MAYPPPVLACKGLSRHILGRERPAVFHDPLHAACLWIVRAYRVLPMAAEQILRAGGDSIPKSKEATATRSLLKSVCFPRPNLGIKADRQSAQAATWSPNSRVRET